MKKIFVFALFIPIGLQAQLSLNQFHLNLFGGFSNYSGDLQSKRFTLDQSYGAFGIGAQYDLTSHFSVLSGFNLGKVGAADKFNKIDLVSRNLSFQSKIFEWNAMVEYNIFDLNEHRFTPYVFAGMAVYHFNPYAYDTLGNKVYLRPLSTEGEGFERKEYSLTQLAIPFGAGIKLRVTSNVVLSYEIGFRKLFTDYLDDVSTRYVDEATLLAARGPLAVEMAYRGNELKNGGSYPAGNTLRGNSKYNDWYYFSGIKVSISFGDGYLGEGSERMGKSRMDCPKKVY
jgi:hypothetical protein